MRKENQFTASHRPYAVDVSSLDHEIHQRRDGSSFWYVTAKAAWFRRRRGQLVACVGYLWDYQNELPQTVERFLQANQDGRYGGTCTGRWDGAGYWGAEQPETVAEHLLLLRPMLDNYPKLPAGYDGWWTFHTAPGQKNEAGAR